MACCLAIAFVFAALRRMGRLWGAAPRDVSQGQAPPARRPAPGETAARVSHPVQPRPVRPRPAAAGPSGLLLGLGLGAFLYAVTVAWLFAVGVAQPISSSGAHRLTVLVVVLIVAATSLVVGARRRAAVHAGRVAIGIGAGLELLSLVDMHLLNPFELAGGNPLVDIAFHGAGPLIAVAGAMLELRPIPPAPSVAMDRLR
jgi:hypothetical protein